MKKIISLVFLLVLCFCFVGCDMILPNGNVNSNLNAQTKNVEQLSKLSFNDAEHKFIYAEGNTKNEINKFAIDTMFELLNDDDYKNSDIFYSPASFYMALSMLAEASDGQTYEQLIKMLNTSSLDTLKTNNSILYRNNNFENNFGKNKIANSFWVRNDIDIKEEFVKTLIDNYYAESFKAVMDAETMVEIAKYINVNTYDLLNVNGEDLQDLINCALILVNTIYFNNQWKSEFLEENTVEMLFNNSLEKNAYFMKHTVTGNYFDREKFTCVSDSFANGYNIYYCLPKDGYTVNDLTSTEIGEIVNGTIRIKHALIKFAVPRFEFTNKLDLVNITKNLGVTDVFDSNIANLSKASNDIFVSNIDQYAGIKLNEKGVEAAAATIIGTKESVPEYDLECEFILDKPFLYYITDSNGIVLFMGVCVNPTYVK